MPIMDGLEASSKIKNHDDAKDIPIVAVTAAAMKDEKIEILEICDGLVSKPYEFKDIVNQISRFIKSTKESPKTPSPEVDSKTQEIILFGDISSDDFSQLHKLVLVLDNEINSLPHLKKFGSLNEIEKFGYFLENLGLEFKCSGLTSFAKKILHHTQLIQLDEMYDTLSDFPTLVSDIKDFSLNSDSNRTAS